MRVPGDLSSAAFSDRRGVLVPGSRVVIERRRREPDPRPACSGSSSGWAPARGSRRPAARRGAAERAASATSTSRRPLDAAPSSSGDEVPLAIDELPLVALLGCFAEGETVVTRRGGAARKESDRIAGVVEALARPRRRRSRRTDDGFVVRGTRRAARRHDRRRAATTAWRCSAPSPGLASREGVEVRGMEAAAVSYPAFETDLAALLPLAATLTPPW